MSQFVPTTTVYYTDDLYLICECKGIPHPTATWEFNEDLNDVFTADDAFDAGVSGVCNNLLHSKTMLHWSDSDYAARKDADKQSVTCRCGENADVTTSLEVQCKSVMCVLSLSNVLGSCLLGQIRIYMEYTEA